MGEFFCIFIIKCYIAIFFYRIYDTEAKQYPGGMRDNFEIPNADDNVRGYKGEKAYRMLEDDGIVATESGVIGGDILIGKTSPPRFMEEYKEFETFSVENFFYSVHFFSNKC